LAREHENEPADEDVGRTSEKERVRENERFHESQRKSAWFSDQL
jgi:hypothetical protein